MRFAGWYGIAIGGLMLGQWAFFLVTGGVPELRSAPFEIGFHLAAEFVTAGCLLLAGSGLLRSRARATQGYLLSMGMLIYTTIASPGYFAERGQWGMVLMFAALLSLAVLSVFKVGAQSRP